MAAEAESSHKSDLSGTAGSPGHEIMKKQARGFGAMLTIQLESKEFALAILEK